MAGLVDMFVQFGTGCAETLFESLRSLTVVQTHAIVLLLGLSPLVLMAELVGPFRGARAATPEVWDNSSFVNQVATIPRSDWRSLYQEILRHLLARPDLDILDICSPDEHSAIVILKSKLTHSGGCHFAKVHVRCPPGSSETRVWVFLVPAADGMFRGSRGRRRSQLQRELVASIAAIGAQRTSARGES